MNVITEENIAGPLYLQGLRSDNTFVNDDGRQITYFKWDEGEGTTFVRTEILISKRLLQGLGATDLFAAYIEWSSLRRRWEDNLKCTDCDLIFNICTTMNVYIAKFNSRKLYCCVKFYN